MNDSLKARLRSSDARIRQAAIIALGNSKDRTALPLLKQVYEADPEPALRRLARQAGQYIQQQGSRQGKLKRSGSRPAPLPVEPQPPHFDASDISPLLDEPPVYAAYDPFSEESAPPSYIVPPAAPEPEPEVAWATQMHPYSGEPYAGEQARASGAVSAADRRQAQDALKKALQCHERRAMPAAYDLLVEALTLDPGLTRNQTVRELAAGLIKVPPEEAAEVLASSTRRSLYPRPIARKQAKQRRKSARRQGATWDDVWLDLGILAVVVVILMIVLMGGMQEVEQAIIASSYGALRPALSTLPPGAVLLTAGAAGLNVIISTLLSIGAIHFAASRLLNGYGSLQETYHALIPVQIGLLVLWTVGFAVMLFALRSSDLDGLSILVLLTGLGSFYWQASSLARVHGFGTSSGCMALFLGPLVLGAVWCIFSMLLGIMTAVASAPLLS